MLKNKLIISLQLLLELIKNGKKFYAEVIYWKYRNIIIKNKTIKFKTNQK